MRLDDAESTENWPLLSGAAAACLCDSIFHVRQISRRTSADAAMGAGRQLRCVSDGLASARNERGDFFEQTGAATVARDRRMVRVVLLRISFAARKFGLEQRHRPHTGA